MQGVAQPPPKSLVHCNRVLHNVSMAVAHGLFKPAVHVPTLRIVVNDRELAVPMRTRMGVMVLRFWLWEADGWVF